MRAIALGLLALLMVTACGVFMFGVLAPGHAVAQTSPVGRSDDTAPDEPQNEPAAVEVGVYVMNVGALDVSTGAFTVDFYLTLSSDRPTGLQRFEFCNGRATSIDEFLDNPADRFYRIQASLADELDFSDYPFDQQALTIELEDKEKTSATQVYEVKAEESGLDPAVTVPGWDLDGWNAYVTDHYYAPYGTTFSRYVFDIVIHRPVGDAILKTILPALIIVIVGLLSLFLTPDKILARLALATGAFTASVLFHINMTSSLPPLGYLTLGDRFMLVNYFALVLTLVSTLVALHYVDKGRNTAADRVHTVALVVIPVLWLGLVTLNFLV